MKSNRKEISIGLSLSIFSIVLTFLMIEICLRFFIPVVSDQHEQVFFEHDPFLGWKHKTNFEAKYLTSEYRVSEYFNSHGVRGLEYALQKPKNEYRILILGDSFAEGYSVQFDELFSEVLKKKLSTGNKKQVEVINMGVAGYSSDQELLLFGKEGKEYNPNLTILMFYENDVWYNTQNEYWRGEKPLFKLLGDKLILTNIPVSAPNDRSQAKAFSTKRLLAGVKNCLNEHSYLYRFLKERL